MDKNKKLFDGWEVFATKHFEIHWHFIVYTEFQYGHSNSNYTIRNQIFFMILIIHSLDTRCTKSHSAKLASGSK